MHHRGAKSLRLHRRRAGAGSSHGARALPRSKLPQRWSNTGAAGHATRAVALLQQCAIPKTRNH
ncbi:MAG: hypothetical protein ABIW30_01930, partial [Arenimonas sp.]